MVIIYELLVYINTLILSALCLLHGYWGVGGEKGLNLAIPENGDGDLLFKPSKAITLLIAAALAFLAVVTLSQLSTIHTTIYYWMSKITLGFSCVVFFFRAIGDRHWVGFFKSEKNTHFARLDKYYYSPLCVFLLLSTAMIGFKQ